MVDVRIRAEYQPPRHGWVHQEMRRHIFVHKLLKVHSARLAERTDDHIAADPAIHWHVAVRIGNFPVRRIIGNSHSNLSSRGGHDVRSIRGSVGQSASRRRVSNANREPTQKQHYGQYYQHRHQSRRQEFPCLPQNHLHLLPQLCTPRSLASSTFSFRQPQLPLSGDSGPSAKNCSSSRYSDFASPLNTFSYLFVSPV